MTLFYYGENVQERDVAVRDFIHTFVSEHSNMAVDSLQVGEVELTDIIDAVTTVPFLSARRLVIVRYLSSNKELSGAIDKILDRCSDTTDILFIEATVDNRSVYIKTLKKRADEVRHFEVVEGPALVDWLIAITKQHNGTISRPNAQFLVDRIGPHQQALYNEVEKLLLIEPEISRQTIIEMTAASPQSSVFSMLDAVMQGRADVVSTLYKEQRMQGAEPQPLLGMITWQLFILASIVVSSNSSPDDIAKRAKLSPFVVRKNVSVAKSLSRQTIIQLFDAAIATDLAIKTGKAKPDIAVHSLLLNLTHIVKATP